MKDLLRGDLLLLMRRSVSRNCHSLVWSDSVARDSFLEAATKHSNQLVVVFAEPLFEWDCSYIIIEDVIERLLWWCIAVTFNNIGN